MRPSCTSSRRGFMRLGVGVGATAAILLTVILTALALLSLADARRSTAATERLIAGAQAQLSAEAALTRSLAELDAARTAGTDPQEPLTIEIERPDGARLVGDIICPDAPDGHLRLGGMRLYWPDADGA